MSNQRRFKIGLGLVALVIVMTTTVGADTRWPHAPDRLLVGFRAETPERIVEQILAPRGGEIKKAFRRAPGLRLVTLPEGSDLDAAIAFFQSRPEVAYAEPDYIYKIQGGGQTIPDDPRFDEQWGLHNTGQQGGTTDFDIDAPEAWVDQPPYPVTVGVLDTGLDILHEDLRPHLWFNAAEAAGHAGRDDDHNGYVDDIYGWDFVDDDNDPSDDVTGGSTNIKPHGTHVAGTIGAIGNNASGVAGVNWNARIMPLRVCLGTFGEINCNNSDIIEAIDYATDNGAHITNNSYGGGACSTPLFEAIERAHAAGILFVAAAGNNGGNIDTNPFCPASFDSQNIVAVAAMDRHASLWTFSNFGSSDVDLGAPGVEILSTVLDDGYANMSGTSMAAPHVTGALAYLMSFPVIQPNNNHLFYKSLVLDSAVPNDELDGKSVSEGVLNLRDALDLLLGQ